MKGFYPKRPVKSFMDLEVYQKALAICVAVVKRVGADTRLSVIGCRLSDKSLPVVGSSVNKTDKLKTDRPNSENRQLKTDNGNDILSETKRLIATELTHRVLKIPLQIAQAHSWRFADQAKALQTLEEAMTNCNLAVVYLEQYRDICNTEIETEFFEEQVKGLVGLRQKTLYLQRSWRKFIARSE